jgi:GntR family transcriptional repressor for pyruvate dehydrogenase complex
MAAPEIQTAETAASGRRASLDRRNTYAKVADDVLEMLKSGELTPGSPMMSEREITQTYGVGRSSAREALRVLEARGLIVGDGRGSFIVADPITTLSGSIATLLDLQRGSVRDVYEVRLMIEVENAALAATRRSDQQLEQMKVALAEQRDASLAHHEGRGDVQTIMEADVRFHMVIAAASSNSLALTIMEGIQTLLRGAQIAVGSISGLSETSLREHHAILEAIDEGAADAARAAMREHLERVEHDAERVLDRPALDPLGTSPA